MKGGWFIAGTDTEIGKTWVAEAMLLALRAAGRSALGMKPVATGCRRTPAGLRSEDAERLMAASGVEADYDDVNPYAFEPAIAPHAAAARVGVDMSLEAVTQSFVRLAKRADWLVVEGVGGWQVPFNRRLYVSDVARALGLPVVLVVGVRLGCINHALLSARAIASDGLTLAGWVANGIDPAFESRAESVAAIEERLQAPCLAVVPPSASAAHRRYGEIICERLCA